MIRPYQPALQKKQSTTHEDFLRIWQNIGAIVPKSYVDDLIEDSALQIATYQRDYPKAAYAWSGGKDSIALQIVCQAAGIDDCVLAICNLEFPAFLHWIEAYKPPKLDIRNVGLDLEWLAANPKMLFPTESQTAGHWFQLIQHRVQADYFRDNQLDMILLGRRLADGNYVGKNGLYRNRDGTTRLSPLYQWEHEDVLAVCHYYGQSMPPFYDWPRGFRVGTGPWAKRRVVHPIQGWREIMMIDSNIVLEAAAYFPMAELVYRGML